MKMKIISIFIVALFISSIILVNSVSACTGFTSSTEELTLVGSNEDWWLPDPYIKIQPPEEEKHGYVIFEYGFPLPWDNDFMRPFAGMNDQGLLFDFFYTPKLKIKFNPNKPLLLKDPTIHFMEKFSTVDQVIDYLNSYNIFLLGFIGLNEAQMFVADKTGASAIIEGDDIILKQGDFQVVSNFLQTRPDLGELAHAFERYDIAVSMLENMTELSVNYFRKICNATHQESVTNPTQYSHIFDLKDGIIYLNHYHDFEKTYVIDLEKEFSNGEQSYFLPSFFEPVDNQPPNIPEPIIITKNVETRKEYFFDINETTDPDNEPDEIYYMIDFGDGTYSKWINSYVIKENIASHSWNRPGKYDIKIKASDIYGMESDWSDPFTIHAKLNKLTKLIILGALGVFGLYMLFKLLD